MRIGNYNCFSYKQKEFLKQNGLEPIHEMVHSKTNRTLWVFTRNESLDNLLSEWQSNKK